MVLLLTIIWIYIIDLITVVSGKSLASIRHGLCRQNLFNESSSIITEDSFRASSVLDDKPEHKAFQARISSLYETHKSGKSWCPQAHASSNPNEYIQVDLSNIHIVTMIFTTGRGQGNFVEYTPNFGIKYQRDVNQPWIEYNDSKGSTLLTGNKDPRTLSRVELNPPIIARNFRIYPISPDAKASVCLRFALSGCLFDDALLDYSTLQGSPSQISSMLNRELDLTDSLYKVATTDQTHLFNDLGQLTDNKAVLFSYSLSNNPMQAGNALVGWNRQHIHEASIRILFNFEDYRNITQLSIFTINNPSVDCRIFSSLHLETSEDGVTFEDYHLGITGATADMAIEREPSLTSSSQIYSFLRKKKYPSIIQPGRDPTDALIVNVPISTNERPLYAKSVRLSLKFASDWIILSEVFFHTYPVDKSAIIPTERRHSSSPQQINESDHNEEVVVGRRDDNPDSSPKVLPSYEIDPLKDQWPINSDESAIILAKDNSNNQQAMNDRILGNSPPGVQTRVNGIEDFIANRPSSFFLIGGSILIAFTLSLVLAFILHFYCHRRKRLHHESDDQLNKNGNVLTTNAGGNLQAYQTLALNPKDPSFNDQIQFQFNPYLQPNSGGNLNLLQNPSSLTQQQIHLIQQQQQQTNGKSSCFNNNNNNSLLTSSNPDDNLKTYNASSTTTNNTTQISSNSANSTRVIMTNQQHPHNNNNSHEDSISPVVSIGHPDEDYSHMSNGKHLMTAPNSSSQPRFPHNTTNHLDSEGQDYASTSICGLPQSPIILSTTNDLQHHNKMSETIFMPIIRTPSSSSSSANANNNNMLMQSSLANSHNANNATITNPGLSDVVTQLSSINTTNNNNVSMLMNGSNRFSQLHHQNNNNTTTNAVTNLLSQIYDQNQRNILQQTLQRFPPNKFPVTVQGQAQIALSQFTQVQQSQPANNPTIHQQFQAMMMDQNQNLLYNTIGPQQDYYTNQMFAPQPPPPSLHPSAKQYPQMTQIKPPEPPLNHPTSTNSKRNSVYSVCI